MINFLDLNKIALLFAMSFAVTVSYGQSLSTSYYGIWDRGEGVVDYSDPKAAFVLGIETTALWEDIQKTGPSNWDFSAFQQTLNTAVLNNKLVRFSINVGPESPMWIFANGVPLVNVLSNATKNDKYANRYPYYLNATYKDFYFKMIEQFALFLRNQPEEKFKHIAFVQVKTGSTGDEEAYKGTAIDPQFVISPTNWEKFRLEAFTQFKKCFNDVPDHKIVLTFNNVDPDQQPEAYNFVMNDLDPLVGFGIKGGAYNRGHHLSDEQTYKEQWNPFLINPKPGPLNPKGVKLFSASEMDQSWKKGFFALNYEIGFYWAALGGINTGVSCTNVSVSAMEYAYANPGIIEIFKMYNRYAQQVYPETATTVFSIFHEGLNAADIVKFPIKDYNGEPAIKSNVKRYLAIVNSPKYYNRGARVEDQLAVVAGQVYQRESQNYYNDAGWEICEGNIERFFTQIKPDSTSIGLFRVRGAITATSSKYDRFAQSFEHATGKDTMYFKFDPDVFTNTKPKSLQFKIIWLDKTVGSNWSFKYKSPQGIVDAIQVSGLGDNSWKEVTFTLSNAIVDGSGIYGSDFMLVNTDHIDDIFNGIEIGIEREITTGIPLNNLENDVDVQIFPNPTKSIINLKSSHEIKSVELCYLHKKQSKN
ncbi:MAG: T9SS C-terminal target domain-containing protein [Bacteroidia bacterium]|nr:T9SS C-terminal target domain-containing protein [Bacteroidia bacterium]